MTQNGKNKGPRPAHRWRTTSPIKIKTLDFFSLRGNDNFFSISLERLFRVTLKPNHKPSRGAPLKAAEHRRKPGAFRHGRAAGSRRAIPGRPRFSRSAGTTVAAGGGRRASWGRLSLHPFFGEAKKGCRGGTNPPQIKPRVSAAPLPLNIQNTRCANAGKRVRTDANCRHPTAPTFTLALRLFRHNHPHGSITILCPCVARPLACSHPGHWQSQNTGFQSRARSSGLPMRLTGDGGKRRRQDNDVRLAHGAKQLGKRKS